MYIAKIIKNMKQNICIKPYNYKQQYQLLIPYTSKNNYIIPYKQQVYKYYYSIIPTPPTPTTPTTPTTPSTPTNYKQIYNSIITYKHNKVIISTTISSFIIYKILYCYIIYFHMNTLFDL